MAQLLCPDPQVRQLHALASLWVSAARTLAPSHPHLAGQLCDLLGEVLGQLQPPRWPSDRYLARLQATGDPRSQLWEGWQFGGEPLPWTERREALERALERLQAAQAELSQRYPGEGQLLLTGHAHIDLAWLWPTDETRRKARRTFWSVIRLMERFPELHFNQSSAQIYRWIEEEDPELFERIRQRVAEGRWELVGGMWVEPDGNLPSGESWARQLLYGQRYFQSRFGRMARVAWLPDSFGYAGNLPQIFLGGGLQGFFTTKMHWNESNRFPFDAYLWEGIDGSRILSHGPENPVDGYNGVVDPESLLRTWSGYRAQRYGATCLFPFGYGDGGGGPSEEMLDRARQLQGFPGLPSLQHGRVEDFMARLARRKQLPTWFGEQYLELHRGTYTTQSAIKKLHRQLEATLVEAELAASLEQACLGGAYPSERLLALWTILLRNEFHDILPGSGVASVYQTARSELSSALEIAQGLRDQVLQRLSASLCPPGLAVWNLSLTPRPLRLEIPALGSGDLEFWHAGVRLPAQATESGWVIAADLEVPPVGYLSIELRPGAAPQAGEIQQGCVLDNGLLRAVVGEDGTVQVRDLEVDRELLSGRGNQIWIHPDLPRSWEAWDVDPVDQRSGEELVASSVRQLESGPVRWSVEVLRQAPGLSIQQRYRLVAGSRRLAIETEVTCSRRRTWVQAHFPLAIQSRQARFETAFGLVTRPTHRNTSWDAAQFEVPALRLADLSEGDYGVSLLNDGKYGHAAEGSVLSLSLLRSPTQPDPLADEGGQSFCYALYPHRGNGLASAFQEALDLNAPLRVCLQETPAERPVSFGWLRLEGVHSEHTPVLSALKRAEDGEGWILRIYDQLGGSGRFRLESPIWEVDSATDLLEQPSGPAQLERRPFGVLSLRLRRTGAAAGR